MNEPKVEPAVAARGVEAEITLSGTLRQATAELHRRAERSEFQQAFVAGRLPRAAYGRWLEQMWCVYNALEGHLWRAPLSERYRELLNEALRRTPELEADLAFFGLARRAGMATAAARAFEDRMAAWAEAASPALLGVLYVLEGSTNGSRFIARGVRQAYALAGTDGTRFLDPYGEAQTERWGAFKRSLDAAVGADEATAVVAGASATFEAITAVGQELLAEAGLQPL